MRYENKLSAIAAAEHAKEQSYNKFCPLIKELCNLQCVCYNNVVLKEHKTGKEGKAFYVVYGGYCDNPMLIRGE